MMHDMDGTIRFWSTGCQVLFGWSAGQAVGQSADSLLHPVFPLPQAKLAAALEYDGQWIGEMKARRRDGAELTVGTYRSLRLDMDAHPIGVVSAFVDFTAQRGVGSAILDSETLFKAYFENSADCLFHVRVEPNGRFVYEAINPAGLAHTGTPLDLVLGRTPEEVLGPQLGGRVSAALRRAVETGESQRCGPGSTIDTEPDRSTCDAIYLPLRNAAGEITGIIGDARDISSNLRLGSLLRQTQKIAAPAEPAASVAHDFNNVLAGLLGSLELLEEHVTSDEGKTFIAACFKSVERGRMLTARLLASSRPQPAADALTDLNAMIENMVDRWMPALGGGLQIEKHLAPDVWPVAADRNQLELAILNLVINSRDTLPPGGTLTIETRNDTIVEGREDGLAGGDYAVIVVEANGKGVESELPAEAAAPLSNASPLNKGHGLGLSMVYVMLRQLGAEMNIASNNLGNGIQITLFFPRAVSGHPVGGTS